MQNDTKLKTKKTGTKPDRPERPEIEYCLHCSCQVKPIHQSESALDRDGLEIGVVHSGHCAHQHRLYIHGQSGHQGGAGSGESLAEKQADQIEDDLHG